MIGQRCCEPFVDGQEASVSLSRLNVLQSGGWNREAESSQERLNNKSVLVVKKVTSYMLNQAHVMTLVGTLITCVMAVMLHYE